jgi:hypothetical protein
MAHLGGSHQRGWGLYIPEQLSGIPMATLPSLLRCDCKPGLCDQYKHNRPIYTEFTLLLRLIRPHHPPWMKATIKQRRSCNLGLINSVKSPQVRRIRHCGRLTLVNKRSTRSSMQLDQL